MLELSVRESMALHHFHIGTEHILLSLLREGQGLAAKILQIYDTLDSFRRATLDEIRRGGDRPGLTA